MNIARSTRLTTIALLSTFAFTAAAAVEVRVRCEKQPNRSTISVDAKGLSPGSYYAVVRSGANSAQSLPAAAKFGEVEVDYDSNPKDIGAGDTPISPDFIVDGRVTGTVLNSNNQEVISDSAICRVRVR